MVKNYLVCAVRPITDGWLHQKRTDLYTFYREMYDISLASYKKFVEEPFESILWEEPVKNNDEYTIANWNAIKELWHKESCNIFWAGADTIMTQPTSLFSDRFKEYRLFNYTDPKEFQDCPHFFNADIRYYPAEMSQEVWDFGLEMANNWDMEEWNTEQVILNKMMWHQGLTLEEARKKLKTLEEIEGYKEYLHTEEDNFIEIK